jgi:hypothetical protein
MATSHWITPRADAACGRAFHPDRPTADGYRVALAFWYRATGRDREGNRLAVYRCKRCCGFHIAYKRVVHESVQPPDEVAPYGPEPDTVESWIDLEAVPYLAV